MKVLLIEDEKMLGDSIMLFLKQEGYVCEWVNNFNAGDEKISMYSYDCALVDIGLPGGSGLDLVQSLKRLQPKAGIIIISAKNSLDDKVSGLDLGADDYLTKPFHLSELNSRIKSLLRRRNFEGSHEIVVGDMKIIPESFEVQVNGRHVMLTKKEYGLLLYFVSNKNRVLTKEAIAEHLWGDEADAMDSFDFVYSHIKNLRKKIISAGGQDFIESVYGMGYKFVNA
ncbi:MAG: response regulator transcription factor [Flavobacteriales bacterium]|nr:response regulator transcription factor [Flavobacteriales bacterium]